MLTQRSTTPPDQLQDLDETDRDRVQEVGFLVASPVDQDGVPVCLPDVPAVHVFYPTKEPSPVSLILHGEFLVKGDRSALLPIEDTPFNSWVANSLSEATVRFVLDSYDPRHPSAFVRLLRPVSTDVRRNNANTGALWDKLASQARQNLRLPNRNASLSLGVSESLLLQEDVVNKRYARRILEKTQVGQTLLHPSFDGDSQARNTLKELGCGALREEDVLQAIEEYAEANAEDNEWLWSCWEWLSGWYKRRKHTCAV